MEQLEQFEHIEQQKSGRFIAERRKAAGLTQAALAEKLGITDRAASKWETGKCLPDASIMLELCKILDINVNELLTGEKIAMDNYENYKEAAEKNLMEIIRVERDKNSELRKAERFIGWGGVIVSLLLITVGLWVAFSNAAAALILIISGCVILLVCVFYATLVESEAGYFECGNCKNRYVPSKRAVIFALHIGSDRMLKCPSCSKRCWHKQVVTRE